MSDFKSFSLKVTQHVFYKVNSRFLGKGGFDNQVYNQLDQLEVLITNWSSYELILHL